MEAVPLPETSAAACAKALTFTWISSFGVPAMITLDRHNLLPIFGFSFARCLTSHTGKQPLIIRSQTAQLKDCTAASRMHSVHAPLQRHGRRSYPLCSLDLAHSRGKTLVFPHLRQFLVLPIVLPNEFLQNEEILVDSIIKSFSKTLDVPATSLPRHNSSTSCPASCQPNCSLPPLSGSVVESFRPFSRSTMAPMPFCAVAPAPSPTESGHGTRSSPSAASRPVWQRMPRLAAHVSAADCRVRAQVALP
jgi:hypothetical protein